jgi:phosphatidylserine/phosphatidylglycerophosphate/cardiolipin synthase-like enzyme
MYGLSDPDIKVALKKAMARGVEVYLFYDPSGSPCPGYGHPVKAGGLMHRKICIIDKKIGLIGTANFTTSSLKMHQNLIVGFHSPEIANHFIQSSSQRANFEINETHMESFFLPDFENIALENLISWIDEAQETIYAALFTFTHPKLINALSRAVVRGVTVSVAIDLYTARGASRSAASALSKAGATILISQGEELLHHKWALIDSKKMVMGSANWTKAAFEQNQDVLIFFDSLGHEEITRLQSLWRAVAIGSKKQ